MTSHGDALANHEPDDNDVDNVVVQYDQKTRRNPKAKIGLVEQCLAECGRPSPSLSWRLQ